MAEVALTINSNAVKQYSEAFARKLTDYFFIDHSTISGKSILNFCDVQQVNLLIIKHLFEKWQSETSRFDSPYFNYQHQQVQVALKAFMNVLSQHIQINKENFYPLLVEACNDAFSLILNPRGFYQTEIKKAGAEGLKADYFKQISKYIQFNKELLKSLIYRLERGSNFTQADVFKIVEDVYSENRHYIEPMDWRIKSFDSILPLDINRILSGADSFLVTESQPIIEETKTPFDLSFDTKPVFNFSEEVKPSIETIELKFEETQPEITPVLEEKLSTLEENLAEIKPTWEEKVVVLEENITETSPEISPTWEEKLSNIEENTVEINSYLDNSPAFETETKSIIEDNSASEIENVSNFSVAFEPKPVLEDEIISNYTSKISLDNESEDDISDLPGSLHAKLKEENFLGKTVADKFQQAKINNLRDSISLNQKFQLINQLFKGDSLEFNNALDKLDNCTHLGEALVVLKQEYAEKNNWDWDGEDVDNFLELIERRFL